MTGDGRARERNRMHWTRSACIASVILFFSGCFLTTEMGFQPYGSVRGNEVRQRVLAMASVGFTVGRMTYEREKGLGHQPDGGDIVNAWETGVMTHALAGVQDDRYYVIKSVKDCEESVLLYSAYYAYSLSLNSFGSDKPEDAEAVNGGAAAFAAVECNLVKVGRWISANEQINF